jgi:hypothetical protein
MPGSNRSRRDIIFVVILDTILPNVNSAFDIGQIGPVAPDNQLLWRQPPDTDAAAFPNAYHAIA